MSKSRTSTPSRAYSLFHNKGFRNINGLSGSWTVSSSSLRIDSLHLRSRTALSDSRCFSAFSAIRINKAGYDKLRLDPIALEHSRAIRAQQSKAIYHKIREDPKAWKVFSAKRAERRNRHIYSSPEVRRKRNENGIRTHARLSSTQTNSRLSGRLYEWTYFYEWVRALPWKSHQPLVYDEPVEHYCHECQLVRHNGMKLWWQSKSALLGETQADVSKEAQYLCHRCYTKQRPWSEVMPEGYEDVNTLKTLVARRNQLDGAIVKVNLQRDETKLRRYKISNWCWAHDWIRQLPWPTHQPQFFEQKMELHCTDCLWSKRRALRLWWQDAKGTHICTACYTKPDWSEIMPKGYEDVTSMRDFRARKQQLDKLASGHAYTSSHTPSSSHRQVGSNFAQATLTRPASSLPTSLCAPTSRKFSFTSAASVSKDRYKKLREDPVRYERSLEYNRLYFARLRSDKKAYRTFLEQVAASGLKKHDEDAASRERGKSRSRIHHAKALQQPAYLQSRMINNLLMHYPWSRAGLPWKSHLPLVSAEPIERHCSGCGITRRGGSKLWWQKIDAAGTKSEPHSQSFLCHSCYFPKDDWACAMPEGYEDVKSIKELVARNEQLDGSPESGKYARGESVFRAGAIYNWVQHEWVCLLPWKTHRPVLCKQKVYDRCARCKSARHICLKLWWRSPTETICNLCHAKQGWNDAMPHGYEDVRSMKELRARKEQLEEEGPGSEPQHRVILDLTS